MPTLKDGGFSQDEETVILPLFDHQRKLLSCPPFDATDRQKDIHEMLLVTLFRDKRFCTPVPSYRTALTSEGLELVGKLYDNLCGGFDETVPEYYQKILTIQRTYNIIQVQTID